MSRSRRFLVLAVLALGSCTDASTMFSGRWVATEALHSEWLSGKPELAIGHYGPEVTGVAYFANAAGVVVGPCPCAYIDHQRVDLDARTFRATTQLACDGSVWLWELALQTDDNDNPYLVGTVSTTDGSGRSLPIELALLDRFIPEDRRVCE